MDPQVLYRLARPLLFSLSPETAHDLVIAMLERMGLPRSAAGSLSPEEQARLQSQALGHTFTHPVGLAAGFDKDGRAEAGLAQLGFGFIELGTVTPRPQAGNPQPRLFRLAAARALINRLGFNNQGAEAMAHRLARRKPPGSIPRGINIGRNRETPNEAAADDYLSCLTRLFACADYFVVNVSSPNTPGLRQLQSQEHLNRLLKRLQETNQELADQTGQNPKPLLLKIAPELGAPELDSVCQAALNHQLAGIIATNTSTRRDDVAQLPHGSQDGGLSGPPLAARAEQVVAALYRRLGDRLVIIGVGGIEEPAGAYRRIRAGASLLQVYTALIYHGPSLPVQLARGIAAALAADGLEHLQDAVGRDAHAYPEPQSLG